MESPLLGGYIGATATAGSHEASERQRAPISRASASERGARGRAYRPNLAKVREVLRAGHENPGSIARLSQKSGMPPLPPGIGDCSFGGFLTAQRVGRIAWRS